MTDTQATCSLCGEPMPPGEEMFKFHGYSGPCPKPPLKRERHFNRNAVDLANDKDAAFVANAVALKVLYGLMPVLDINPESETDATRMNAIHALIHEEVKPSIRMLSTAEGVIIS